MVAVPTFMQTAIKSKIVVYSPTVLRREAASLQLDVLASSYTEYMLKCRLWQPRETLYIHYCPKTWK
jgi:hypothetical protein